jgi:hypothetical protein
MVNVTLTAHAYERIGSTLLSTDDGREMGGPLAGYERGGTVIVDDAIGADWLGGTLKRTPAQVQMHDEEGLRGSPELLHARGLNQKGSRGDRRAGSAAPPVDLHFYGQSPMKPEPTMFGYG